MNRETQLTRICFASSIAYIEHSRFPEISWNPPRRDTVFRYTSRLLAMEGTGISRHKFLWAATAAASISILPAEVRAAAKLSALGEPPSTIPIFSSATPILFNPEWALGSSMDILPHDVVEKIFTEPMVKQYLSAGWEARGAILATDAGISRGLLNSTPSRALLRISSTHRGHRRERGHQSLARCAEPNLVARLFLL